MRACVRARLRGVPRGHDVGLHGIVGGVGGVARHDDALEEHADGGVGVVAYVARKEDGREGAAGNISKLLLHKYICIYSHPHLPPAAATVTKSCY